MKILYVSQHYPPEMGALAGRASELSSHWAALGHKATVLTGFPNHPDGVIRPEYREKFRRLFFREQVDGVDVVRTWLLPYPNRKPIERILNYGSFCVSASLRGAFLEKPDVVIGTSPPLPIAIAGYIIARIKRVPFIFEVRDLWPESLEGVGLGAEKSRLYRSVAAIVRFLYKHSDHIVVVTPRFKEYLHEKWQIPLEKMSVVVNGVQTEKFRPMAPSEEIQAEFGVNGKFVAAYVGTMGMAHGLKTVFDAATLLRNDPQTVFLLVGDGGTREEIEKLRAERNLQNVIIAPRQPRERIPEILNSADVCLVLLKDEAAFKKVIPTKMLEAMSCGRPVVMGVGGQADEILNSAGAGIAARPEDAQGIADAIRGMRDSTELRRRCSENGRRYILANFERADTANSYLEVLAKVTGQDNLRPKQAATVEGGSR